MASDSTILRPASGVISRDVGDELVLLDVDSGNYFRVNGSGAELWQQLSSGASEGDLIAYLTSEFGIDTELAERDVKVLLAALLERNLVEPDVG